MLIEPPDILIQQQIFFELCKDADIARITRDCYYKGSAQADNIVRAHEQAREAYKEALDDTRFMYDFMARRH